MLHQLGNVFEGLSFGGAGAAVPPGHSGARVTTFGTVKVTAGAAPPPFVVFFFESVVGRHHTAVFACSPIVGMVGNREIGRVRERG